MQTFFYFLFFNLAVFPVLHMNVAPLFLIAFCINDSHKETKNQRDVCVKRVRRQNRTHAVRQSVVLHVTALLLAECQYAI